MKYASLFTGGGLADWGARMAGLTPVWGVEYDPAIAAVAQQNDPSGTVYAADVRAVDYADLPRVDVLHASPPCPNFSVAKTGRGETTADLELADAVVRAIEAQRPALFTLENVRGYAASESLARITTALFDLDYHVTSEVVNAADYGVPQTRERLFIVARAGGWFQSARPLPAPVAWRGWYQAIEDLIPTLPASAFAPWQLARLPEAISESTFFNNNAGTDDYTTLNRRSACESVSAIVSTPKSLTSYRAFIVDGQNTTGDGKAIVRSEDAHAGCVFASGVKGLPRAFLVESKNSNQQYGDGMRADYEPATTVVTDHKPSHQPRAWLAHGRVVAMTPRALARFQSLPDAYVLPESKALACRIIGNGVACEAYAEILRSQLA